MKKRLFRYISVCMSLWIFLIGSYGQIHAQDEFNPTPPPEPGKLTILLSSDPQGVAYLEQTNSYGIYDIGSEVTEHALINLAVAFLALAAYISYRFEYKVALSSLAAIFHDLIMVLGVFSFFHLEIDSSFLAAILTVIGYSMNESVVIFDRIRENTHTHKRTDTFADLANASIAQSIHRSCYTLTTVLFACCSLYFFGGDTTKNFALCMIVGFVSGAYSSICVATSLWSIWKSRNRKDARNQVAKKA